MRRIAVLDAPSNLGLRPPTPTSVPGCAKAPGALRDQGLLPRLGARDAGCLTPPRYDPGDWRPGDGVAHAAEIAAYSRALADRIGAIIDGGEFPVVLGGDCSILIGSGLAMHRLGEAVGGRIGLVFVDGHSDFRHPGNASYVGAAAGEDLALVTGRGQANLAAIESRRPYFRDIDVVVLGIRAQDEYRLDLQAAGIVTRPVPMLRAEGAARSAQWARDQLVDCAGYWVHVDVDVLDPAVMPAVDAPDPGGIAFPELELLLTGLVESPHCLGVEITVFDPDYDPDGRYAAEITSAVVSGLAPVRTVTPRPDLIAARKDLANQPAAAPAARNESAPAVGSAVGAGVRAESASPAEDAAVVGAPAFAEAVESAPAAELGPASGRAALAEPAGLAALAEPAGLAALAEPAGAAEAEASVIAPSVAERASDGFLAEISDSGAETGAEPERAGTPAEDPIDRDPAESTGEELSDGDPAAPVGGGLSDGDPAGPVGGGLSDGDPAGPVGGGLSDEEPAASVDVGMSSDDAVAPVGGPSGDDAAIPVGEELPGEEPADAIGETLSDEELSEPGAASESESESESELENDKDGPVSVVPAAEKPVRPEIPLLSRPLGSAPLLDSEPLPATRPGMLRPRTPADPPAVGAAAVPRPGFGPAIPPVY
ncbi:arginase [Actinoplanes sp. SE50]|nr:arginase [Actinoplanes sp. SE50/110]ATO86697.1 arginase [Actinoplanes sp. SE50]SLM04115.1 Arginase [Actinoplanes sp. SE50/110]